jgi:hypothetical protein
MYAMLFTNMGKLLALPTKFRLGWKVLPGTNALANKAHLQVMNKIKYIFLVKRGPEQRGGGGGMHVQTLS